MALAGCDSPPATESCAGADYVPYTRSVQLTDLPLLRPIVVYHPGAPTVDIGIRWSPTEFDAPPGRDVGIRDGDIIYCPLFHFTATIAGSSVASPKGYGWLCDGPSGQLCITPTVTLDVPSGAPAPSLELSDESISITRPLGELFAARSATPVDAGGWTLHAGETTSVRWAPASDLASYRTLEVYLTVPCATCMGGSTSVGLRDASSSGETIRFTPPADVMGPAKLSFHLSGGPIDQPDLLATADQSLAYDVTIVP